MNFSKWISKNSSGILSIAACVGVVATAVLSFRGAIKSKKTMTEWEEEKHEPLTKVEKVQASVKHMIPATIACATTIGCIVGAHKINKEHIAALVGAGAITAKKYDDYRKANIEVNGREAHERVVEKLQVQKAKQSNITSESMFEITSLNSKLSKEEFLFHDDITDEYFTGTLAQVLDAINGLNRNFTLGHPEVDVQMWCDFLGIENKKHDNRGWVLCDEYTWIDFDISDPVKLEDGLEVIEITPLQTPIKDYLEYDWMGEYRA